jgi:hypothetical protein
VWLELIASRAALGRGATNQARDHLARAEALAGLTEDLGLAWLVSTAQARLARREGDDAAALAAYEAAAELADRLALSVRGSEGRSMLVTAHSRADAEQLELLVELDRPAQALCVATGARARHLRSLWARLRPPLPPDQLREYQSLLAAHDRRRSEIDAALDEAWSLSKAKHAELERRLAVEGERADVLLERVTALLERDAPRWTCARVVPDDPSHALLTMMSDAERERWWFMLARGGETPAPTIVELDADASPDALAARALAQLGPQLHELDTLVVIPVGEFVDVDVHRLLLAGPGADVSVRYSLGLGDPPTDDAHTGTQRRAAVVAGARDLAAVADEAARVTEALRGLGWSVSPRWSPTALPQPSLLHYAGHGHRAGLAGWRSHVEIPELGPVSAAQIVAAQRAPRLVVLGACSAGSSDPEIIDGGMNLAAAFVLAGAELVIAPSGPVDDEVARALAGELYADLAAPDPEALAAALHERQRAELEADTVEPAERSTLRWRAWVP